MTPPASGLTARAAQLPVLRVGVRLGPTVLIQALGLCYFLGCLVLIALGPSDLLNPTSIGSDASNYYAAGLRLNAGHPLYALSPGDRAVPLIPPFDAAPLLSPPPAAVLWRVLALLPGDLAMTLWFAGGALVLALAGVWLLSRLSLGVSPAILVVGPASALAAWSGNINPYLVAALIVAWLAHERGQPIVAGAIAGVAAGLKLYPIVLLAWFVARRDWRGAGAMAAAVVAVGLVSLAGAGLANHLAYLDVARATNAAGGTPLALPAILASFGVPAALATAAPTLTLVAGSLAMWPLRRHPCAAWSLALAAGIFGTPIVHAAALAMLLAALAPYRTRHPLGVLRLPAVTHMAGNAEALARSRRPFETGGD